MRNYIQWQNIILFEKGFRIPIPEECFRIFLSSRIKKADILYDYMQCSVSKVTSDWKKQSL